MRYSEKSFEVRFCAALTAAVMPLNRNPKWFGLTQAQERRVGIDTVLGIGGRLIIFQFKAQQAKKVKLECDQLKKLTTVQKKYPRSTFYVFPEEDSIFAAGKAQCLFPSARVFQPRDIATSVYSGIDSVSFSLDATKKKLERKRPASSFPVCNACEKFGCFCNKSHHELLASLLKPSGWLRFLAPSWDGIVRELGVTFPSAEIGIPIARDPGEADLETRGPEERDPREMSARVEPITNEEQFEALFGDDAGGDLEPGAYGFFIPYK
ncbi:hypothetical protein [Paracoccus aestuarii]|uniref:hypothetical protein n=1 Tax=Paracoccus aestuarii TaxID=453842 RepID=UPI0011C3565B|nr:hypothetical protein [Paracoccus aestuarii]WCQ98936.1 hypothetical protein JHW48_13945 [Paracoccus aestuarii]